jgi:hypothetical protein
MLFPQLMAWIDTPVNSAGLRIERSDIAALHA